jgi:CheY-like chemotaxis protein
MVDSPRPAARRVLLVEDDAGVRHVLRRMLEGGAFDVIDAQTGTEALNMIRASRPDALIVDLLLPQMNGLQLLEALQAAGVHRALPIIAITGTITSEEVVRELGAAGLLRKPFKRAELLTAIETVLHRGPTAPAARPRGRVLIIEDDPAAREMLETMFRFDGYETIVARNGAEGLQEMRQCRPSAVLLDLMMPVMDGWQFRKRQLADPALASIPVVCVTGVASPHDVEARLGLPCFNKPFDIDSLLAAVARHCQP